MFGRMDVGHGFAPGCCVHARDSTQALLAGSTAPFIRFSNPLISFINPPAVACPLVKFILVCSCPVLPALVCSCFVMLALVCSCLFLFGVARSCLFVHSFACSFVCSFAHVFAHSFGLMIVCAFER